MFGVEVEYIPNVIRAPARGPYVAIKPVKRLLDDRFETQSGAREMVSLIMKGLGHQAIDRERMANLKAKRSRRLIEWMCNRSCLFSSPKS